MSADLLCLACSSSLPPRSANAAACALQSTSNLSRRAVDKSFGPSDVFITSCCGRPICPTCLRSNPRLARYNPCLHCLGGVDIINGHRISPKPSAYVASRETVNINGGLRHEDVFSLGDDDDDDDDEDGDVKVRRGSSTDVNNTFFTPTAELRVPPSESSGHDLNSSVNQPADAVQSSSVGPSLSTTQYYIQPGDTLLGIALKFKVDVSLLSNNTFSLQLTSLVRVVLFAA